MAIVRRNKGIVVIHLMILLLHKYEANALIRESKAKIRKWRGNYICYTAICTSHKITKEISIRIVVLCRLIEKQL